MSIFLSAIFSWSSFAQAHVLTDLARLSPTKLFEVTESGVTTVGRGLFNRQVYSNSKLYDSGVRHMKLVNHGGQDYLLLYDAEKKMMTGVLFQRSTRAELQAFKPSAMRQMFTLSGGAKLGNIVVDKAKHFPREALGFAVAIGAITYYQLWKDVANNPMAMQQFVDGQWDGHSQFSFYLFMVAAGIATAPFEEALRQQNRKLLGHFVNYYAMSVGMLASHMYNDVMKIPGMRECSWAMLTGQIRAVPTLCDAGWTEYLKTWDDPDQRAQRWNELSISGLNLIASAGAAAITAYLVEKGFGWAAQKLIVATGINVAWFVVPGGWIARAPKIVGWTVKGGGRLLKATVSATNFMVWTTFLEEPITEFYQNALNSGPELWKLSHCMGVHFDRMNVAGIYSPDDILRGRLNWQAAHCPKSLPQYYEQFLKTSVRWRNENMTPVINSQKSWELHLNELTTYYRTTEMFYQNIIEALDAKRNIKKDAQGVPETLAPIDAEMYYFGVAPQSTTDDKTYAQLAAEREALRLEREQQEMILSNQMMPPLFRAPILPVEVPGRDKQPFTWGLYLLDDHKALEKDQDDHLKYVVRGMYRLYLKMAKRDHQRAAPLTEAQIARAKILMREFERIEQLCNPLSVFSETARLRPAPKSGNEDTDRLCEAYRLRRLAPMEPELKFSEREMVALRDLIAKLASSDRKIVGDGLLELLQSVSPRVSGNTIPAKERKFYSEIYTAFLDEIYKAIGQPFPMKEPGRGYMNAWTLFQEENAKKLEEKPHPESPFSSMNHETFTPTSAEYLATSMVWGPEVNNREEIVSVNLSGFKSNFRPPKLFPQGRVYVWNRSYLQDNSNDRKENIYTRLIWVDSDPTPGCSSSKKECYRPIMKWIRDGHIRPDVLGSENKFREWWNAKIRPPYLGAWAHFEQSYESVIKKFLDHFLGENKAMLNRSEFKNSVLAALNQERQVALMFLSAALDGQFRIKPSTDRPEHVSIMRLISANPQISPVLQAYEKYWKDSVSLYLLLRIPKELMLEGQLENKFQPRVQNKTLVSSYETLNKMVDELEDKLKARAEIRDDEYGDYTKHPQYALAVSALKSLRNSHEEFLDFGLIVNSVSYVETHEDRNNPVLRRCLKTSKTGGAVPFGGGAPSANRPAHCP